MSQLLLFLHKWCTVILLYIWGLQCQDWRVSLDNHLRPLSPSPVWGQEPALFCLLFEEHTCNSPIPKFSHMSTPSHIHTGGVHMEAHTQGILASKREPYTCSLVLTRFYFSPSFQPPVPESGHDFHSSLLASDCSPITQELEPDHSYCVLLRLRAILTPDYVLSTQALKMNPGFMPLPGFPSQSCWPILGTVYLPQVPAHLFLMSPAQDWNWPSFPAYLCDPRQIVEIWFVLFPFHLKLMEIICEWQLPECLSQCSAPTVSL